MLRFLVHLVRTKLLQLSRYPEMSLAMSCDLTLSHDPSASTPTGHGQPCTSRARSCYQPPSHGPQDPGFKMGPLYTPPNLHLPAFEETKLVTPLHLPLYVTSDVTFPVPESRMTKQKVGMEKIKLTTLPHLRPKLRQPAPSVPLLGQTPLIRTQQ